MLCVHRGWEMVSWILIPAHQDLVLGWELWRSPWSLPLEMTPCGSCLLSGPSVGLGSSMVRVFPAPVCHRSTVSRLAPGAASGSSPGADLAPFLSSHADLEPSVWHSAIAGSGGSVMPTREGRTWNSWLCGGFRVPGQLSPSPSGALFSCSHVAFRARHCCCGITALGTGLGSSSTWNLFSGRLLWPFVALCAKGGLSVLPGVGVSLVLCCGSGQCSVGCSICSAVLGNSCVPIAQGTVVSSIPSCLFYLCHGGTWHELKPSG